jgi:hypothetical protein
MAHPTTYYLKYQMAEGWGDPDDPVTRGSLNNGLREYGYPELLEDQYDYIFSRFKPPEELRVNFPKHRMTRAFMKKEKIFELWNGGEVVKRVLSELLDGPAMIRQDIHLMMMGRMPHEAICAKVNKKWRLRPAFTAEMLDVYAHYFWNVKLASYDEWTLMLEGRAYRDSYIASLMCGDQQAMYRAGFSPKVEGKKALKEAYIQAYFRLEAARHEPDSKGTIASFSRLTQRLLSLHAKLHAEGSGLAEQLKEFRQIMMERKDPNVKAIDAVIGAVGSHSGDGGPTILPGDHQDDDDDE